MGYTCDEFARVLHGNFSGEKSELSCQQLATNNWLIRHRELPMTVEISIQARPPRVLGAISLPVLQVIFKVKAATQQQSELFFDKFFKYFHKGGG